MNIAFWERLGRKRATTLHATPLLRWLAWLVLAALLGGCADAPYYAQSVRGHWALMSAARPIDDWLQRPDASDALRQRLTLVQSIRHFAATDLHLPDNVSYTRYADLQRRYAVWNVVAAPADSLTLKTWCFPVAGCVGYRGYFDKTQALALAATLRAQGLEVSVYGVPAYSTLGWSNWLAGDPMLNTFVNYPDGELARLMFHELAHQVVYASDDTAFNESFATAVERLGGALWLARQATPQARQAFGVFDQRRRQFRALTRSTRASLIRVYKENKPLALINKVQVAMKKKVMADFRADYATLKDSWDGYSGYDAWVAEANNAAFAAQAAYDEWVPAFEALFDQQGRDWRRFYDAVGQLARQPAPERKRNLLALCNGPVLCNPPL